MSSLVAPELRMTLAEFLEWDDGTDTRYELIEGVPVAMTPPQNAHGMVAANIIGSIVVALRQRPPCVAVSEAGIISPSKKDTWYQADLAVTCRPHEPGEHETPEPRLIVEVLSPSTEAHDRKVKLPDYRQISSVQEILLVDPAMHYCELHRRLDEKRWLVDLVRQPEAKVSLESIGLDLPLSEIYANVAFEA